ncbi:hypothetical protein NMH_0151 [Neisseria meningitidis H44/76]|uniref:Uncharacterized protein n=3 Tax=Neisseria meningitidis TaxID=487 RepID=A0A0H5DMD1_NEIMI|nr:hypothetical protein NMA510612_0515 [Neisseria meningitidis]EFV64552.1 hypothetical protein NMH_0151 [Neisseria meningitidis H44/76]KER38831.1 hypothetical protein F528_2215 [Neisseria meningitidis 992008]CRL92486.1 hypothetical protein [Neisseria meningitidis serogroup B]
MIRALLFYFPPSQKRRAAGIYRKNSNLSAVIPAKAGI